MGVKIDQSCDTLGMTTANGAQFFTCDGMTRKHGTVEVECLNHGEHIIAQAIRVVVFSRGQRFIGAAIAAAGDAVYAVALGEVERELIKDVSIVAQASEQHEGATCSTPVQHFQL